MYKTASLILASVLTTQAQAIAPVEGVYVGDSTISHAPQRTTIALIEPDGELWSTAIVSGGNLFSSTGVSHTLYGKINQRTGNGFGTEFKPDFGPMEQFAVRITTTFSEEHVKFKFFLDTAPPFQLSTKHNNPPGSLLKRAAYDVVLNKQPNEGAPVIPTGVYVAMGNFSMSVLGNKLVGSYGNCVFDGDLKSAPFFKNVAMTLKNDCYTEDSVTPLTKGIKLKGVMFPSALNTYNSLPVYVLIMKTLTGNEYIGFSKFFQR